MNTGKAMGWVRRYIILWLIPLLIMMACAPSAALSPSGGEDPIAAYDLNRDDSLVLIDSQPRTLDPALTHGGPSGPIGAIFSGLVTLDTDLQVQPELAERWEVSQDGRHYTFYMRPEAAFHDGRPVTAQDVIDSWERAADPKTGSDTAATYLGDIVGVNEMLAGDADHIAGLRAIDDRTLEVEIDAPKVYFLSKLNYPVAYVVDNNQVGQADWERQPNGTGPFTLQEWKDDEVLILARNDNYYLGPPAINHVVSLMGAGIPLSMYETDEIDLVGVGGSNLERVEDPNSPLNPELRLGVDMCTTYAGFNNQKPPFDDPLVRQAFSFAIDRDKIIDGLYRGDALPAIGPLPPGMPGYTGNIEAYSYDPQKARELLAEAGYEDPAEFPEVTFLTSGYTNVGSFATTLITMWQENLGVTVEPVLVEPFVYLDELYAGNTGNIFFSGWCADYPDPENFLDVLFYSDSTQNLMGYNNPQVDTALEKARVETDVSERMAHYQAIEQEIVADAPVVFLVHSLSAVLVKPYVEGYVQTPLGVAQWHRLKLNR